MKKRVKRVFSIHHWLGLLAGVFLLISSITGSVLVFHHEIDSVQFARLSTLEEPAESLLIDNSFGRIRQQYPEGDIRIPALPAAADQALKYEIREKNTRKWIFVHPETGETLSTVERADQRLVHVLLELHYMLLAGTCGKVLVLLGGLALFVLSISGFILYRKSITKVLLFKQGISFSSPRALFSSLHRVVGVWSLVFNLLLCITGSWIAFSIVQHAFSAPSAVVSAPSAGSASVDAALALVRNEVPAFEIKYLRFPMGPEGRLSLLGRHREDPAWYGRTLSSIQVNMEAGTIERVSLLRDQPLYERALKVLKPLHFGDYAGLGVQLLYAFFGLLPGLLAVSGFLLWHFRPRPTNLRQKRPLPRPQAAGKAVLSN